MGEVPKTPSSLQKHQADIAVHLHGVVDLITQRLTQSEKDIGNAVGSYQRGTGDCIERIKRRLEREHKLLVEQWDDDGRQFERAIWRARQPFQEARKTRKQTISRVTKVTKR